MLIGPRLPLTGLVVDVGAQEVDLGVVELRGRGREKESLLSTVR